MAIQIADRHPRLSVVVAELRRLSERREAYAGPRLSLSAPVQNSPPFAG
jgi:hypothetical protein